MKSLNMVGRLMYGLPMGAFGLMHFTNSGMMKGMVPSYMPMSEVWVYLTGAMLLACAYAMATGSYVRKIMMATGAMLLAFVLMIHVPGMQQEGNMMALPMALKDTALAGAAFYMASMAKKED